MNPILRIFQSILPQVQDEPKPPVLPRAAQDRLDSTLHDLDHRLYGMDLELLQRITHSPELQASFAADFGITFIEYLERKAGGEMMGDTQVNGRWTPREPWK